MQYRKKTGRTPGVCHRLPGFALKFRPCCIPLPGHTPENTGNLYRQYNRQDVRFMEKESKFAEKQDKHEEKDICYGRRARNREKHC